MAEPEATDQRIDLAIRLGPRVADVDVGAEAMSDEPLSSPLERRLGRVIDGQLTFRR